MGNFASYFCAYTLSYMNTYHNPSYSSSLSKTLSLLATIVLCMVLCPFQLSAQTNTVESFPAPFRVSAPRLNVRKAPSSESAIIGGLSKGDTINVRSLKKGWAEIDFKKDVGYVSQKYIEPIQIVPVNEPEPQEIAVAPLTENIVMTTEPKPQKPINSFFKQFHFRLTATASLGLSNLYSFDAYSHPRFGFGIDAGTQLTADFMSENMFSEATIGFMSLGNSNYSFPSFSFNLLPIGYRSAPISIWKFHNINYYGIAGLSFQFSGGGIFFSRNSQYYSFYAKPTVNIYAKAGVELSNMVAVGFLYIHGINNVCGNLPIGIKHSTFQIYGSFLFDKWKKK